MTRSWFMVGSKFVKIHLVEPVQYYHRVSRESWKRGFLVSICLFLSSVIHLCDGVFKNSFFFLSSQVEMF